MVLPRSHTFLLRNQLFISCSQCPGLRVTIPLLGLVCPPTLGSTLSHAACDEHPASGKSSAFTSGALQAPGGLVFNSQWQMWGRSPEPSPETWQSEEFMAKLQQSCAGSWGERLTRRFCFCSLIQAPYVKNQGVKKQSLI